MTQAMARLARHKALVKPSPAHLYNVRKNLQGVGLTRFWRYRIARLGSRCSWNERHNGNVPTKVIRLSAPVTALFVAGLDLPGGKS